MSVVTLTQNVITAEVGPPSRLEAEAAMRTLIRWAGDDPNRDGLVDTPARLVRAFEEYFAGYAVEPTRVLSTTFEETNGYDEMIVLRGIPFESIASTTLRLSSAVLGSATCRMGGSWGFQNWHEWLRPTPNGCRYRND